MGGEVGKAAVGFINFIKINSHIKRLRYTEGRPKRENSTSSVVKTLCLSLCSNS